MNLFLYSTTWSRNSKDPVYDRYLLCLLTAFLDIISLCLGLGCSLWLLFQIKVWIICSGPWGDSILFGFGYLWSWTFIWTCIGNLRVGSLGFFKQSQGLDWDGFQSKNQHHCRCLLLQIPVVDCFRITINCCWVWKSNDQNHCLEKNLRVWPQCEGCYCRLILLMFAWNCWWVYVWIDGQNRFIYLKCWYLCVWIANDLIIFVFYWLLCVYPSEN